MTGESFGINWQSLVYDDSEHGLENEISLDQVSRFLSIFRIFVNEDCFKSRVR
jgi:hypothetical protein